MSKKVIIILSVIGGLVVAAGLGVLIWWLVSDDGVQYSTIRLEGEGIGDLEYTAAFTRMNGNDMFWWFYPTLAASAATRPLLLWINGISGTPASFQANFQMFGPYDENMNRREDSWINEYNLLFVDAPLGTGFSTSSSGASGFPDVDTNVNHLLRTLQSFYDLHETFKDSPLYICSQADGAQIAVPLAIQISEDEDLSSSLKGVILGNPIISPAQVLTKLGFYLEELGYIDDKGRAAIENYADRTTVMVQAGQFEEAYDQFDNLGFFVNEVAGAIAVNLENIVQKQTRTSQGTFNEALRSDGQDFMNNVVARALGISADVSFDSQRTNAIQRFKSSFMVPIVTKVEDILQNTNLTVNIYNGNLDAVSTTPGQLEWINNLEWEGQSQFLSSPRETLVFNRLIEGYFRESSRLRFYWINVAGQSVPIDNSIGIRRVLNRMVN